MHQEKQIRASKKQRELLNFIDGFIKGNGYSPSYREVMRALDYKSVSTVAIHINGLIARGFLTKTTHSARSLEVVSSEPVTTKKATTTHDTHIAWLQTEIKKRAEDSSIENQQNVEVLRGALKILDQRSDEQV